MSDAFFRANVGACVFDAQGRVLVLRRKGVTEGGWQMPQGGIEDGESPRAAASRELAEETGLAADVKLVDEYPDWLVYELPLQFRRPRLGWGQAQRWFLFHCAAAVPVRPDNNEFDAYEWIMPAELLRRVIAFRRPIYERVLARFAAQPFTR